jgi:Domain of unknown function (DUF222)
VVGLDAREELVAIGATWARSQQRLVELAAELDRSEAWMVDGANTAAHWIAGALDIEVCTAREWVRVGRALTALPVTAEAFRSGRLSFSKVRALTRMATPATEEELCGLAERVPAGQLSRELARWRAARETPDETEARQHRDRSLVHWVDHDGMRCGHFRLPPLAGGTLCAAIDASLMLSRRSGDATAVASLAQQRADALTSMIGAGGTSTRTEIVLHVRGDGCTFDDGTPIPPSVIERIAPLAMIGVMVHDAGANPIGVSSLHRHPDRRQKRFVKERDRVCVDCGGAVLLQYDHVPDYEITRHTQVDELALRCASCHRRRHRDD